MSAKGRAGRAEWAATVDTYPRELAERIVRDAAARMETWNARGRIPLRVRIMSRLAGRPVRVNTPGRS